MAIYIIYMYVCVCVCVFGITCTFNSLLSVMLQMYMYFPLQYEKGCFWQLGSVFRWVNFSVFKISQFFFWSPNLLTCIIYSAVNMIIDFFFVLNFFRKRIQSSYQQRHSECWRGWSNLVVVMVKSAMRYMYIYLILNLGHASELKVWFVKETLDWLFKRSSNLNHRV